MKIIQTPTGNFHVIETGDGVSLQLPGDNLPIIIMDWHGVLHLYEALEHIIAMVNDEAEAEGRAPARTIETVHLPEPAEASDD